ncbi:MAG: sodium:solute symporter [Acidobacteria bacterium]|nr:sodium:solute symporter [Acidobacteriota bacterium]
MSSGRLLDLVVVLLYMAGMTYVGLRFAGRQTSTERYFVAKRSIPAWAIGMSLFATIVSSVTFIAYPGSGYSGDWSNLIPGLMMLAVVGLSGFVIIPFYREAVGMSAYEYFGKRFGRGARLYSSLAFALTHFTKMGFVIYLVALTITSLTGWDLYWVLVSTGIVTVFYSVVGGLEAVIWADVVQGFIMFAAILICLGYLFFLSPGGPAAALGLAWQNGKFSLGSLEPDLSKPTVLALATYGLFWYLQKYAADQTMVQRYLVAASHRKAIHGATFGAALCIPVWVLFMLIGSLVWSFYRLSGEALPVHITKADQVFPHFVGTHIPAGVAGLFIASMLAAAMSTLASDLNCLAVVGTEDFYRRFKPDSTDRQRLRFGKLCVTATGFLAVLSGLALAQAQGAALSNWFTATSIVSGGLAGLFLLAFLSTRATARGAWTGIVASILFTAWATLTVGARPLVDLGKYNFPLHDYMIGAVGHVVLVAVGYLASLVQVGEQPGSADLTLWGWFEKRKAARRMSQVGG